MLAAIFFPSSTLATASSTPGTKGTPNSLTACLALNLSPMTSIDSGDGPINVIPASFNFLAKPAFSDKKP